LVTKWRIFSLIKHLQQQVHFAVKSASAYTSARGLNGPLVYIQLRSYNLDPDLETLN